MRKALMSFVAVGSVLLGQTLFGQNLEKLVFAEDFSYPSFTNGAIISNEYATWNSRDKTAYRVPQWEQNSGTLYKRNGAGYSGIPQKCDKSSKESHPCNNSAVFRLMTRSNMSCDHVSFSLKNLGIAQAKGDAWDGVHIMLRCNSQYDLMYVSVNRRDNTVAVKRKIPDGGSENKGTYVTLASGRYEWKAGVWQKVDIYLTNNMNKSVTATLNIDNKPILTGTDTGQTSKINHQTYSPLLESGQFGIRGDWTEFEIDNIKIFDRN